MAEEIKLIVQRIKGLREIYGISPESLAEYLGISASEYYSIESGNIDISLGLLIKIAARFNIELAALMTGDDPKLHQYCVVRKNQGVIIERRSQYKYESLAHNFAHKNAEPFIVTIDPAPEAEWELNSDPGQEFNYILQGTMKINLDGHEITLNEGDSIYFDSSYKHAMHALNNLPVKFIAIIIN